MKFIVFSLIYLLLFNITLYSQPKVNDSAKLKVEIDIKDVGKYEKLFHKEENTWIIQYGTIIIALLALFISMASTIANNKTNIKITRLQLLYNQAQDKRKVNIESVSESISLIININKKIINLKKSIGNNCTEVKAYKEYHSTLEMRNKLISNYIKIYITLNDNPIENELAKIFKEYIDKIHVDFNFNKISEFDLENIEKQLMDLSRKTINFLGHEHIKKTP